MRVVALLSALVLALVACGGGEEEPTATATETEAPADDAATEEGTAEPGETEAAAPGGLDEVCAAGAEEGSFEYWATYEDENWAAMAEAFSEAHPGIAIEFLPLRDEDITQRILTSVSAGSAPDPDLISNDLAAQAPLVAQDLIDTEADWTALDVDEEYIATGNVVRTYLVGLGLAYNTDTTSPEDLPDTWEELIDEQYAGDVIVDPRGRPFGFFALEWSPEETLDYVERLIDMVDPILIEGGTAGMTAVLTGEARMSTGGRADSALELQAEGAPVEIKYLDLIPTEADYNALLTGAESRNAAMCFAGWQASEDGLQALEEIEFKQNLSTPAGAPGDAVILSVASPEEADIVADMFEQIGGMFGPGG